jgi:hypothetical protein
MRDAKPARLIKALESEGFIDAGGSKHRKFTKTVNGRPIILSIPVHGIIKRNTVDDIRKRSEIEKAVFYSYKF